MARSPALLPWTTVDWTLCAGGIHLVNILGFLSNFIHRPLCSATNRMVALDVLDDLLRLELQAVAHKVLTEQRDIILQTFLHLNIFFMMLKSETLYGPC